VLRHLPGEAQTPVVQPAGVSPSLTYEPYYGLKEKPFSLSADPKFLFKSPAHAPAFDELLNGIRRREGLITLTGEIGTGKTTLIRSVLQNLDRRTFAAFVPDPFVSREDLLKMLLVDFGVVSIADLKRLAGASRPDLSYPLYEFLDSLVPLQAFAVLILDEAQNLPLPLLEEIRILSDLEGREKLLQVVLVGQPELRSHLKMPEMRQVNQRVSVRCELAPLSRDGVVGYIAHRLGVAAEGQSRVEFSDAAIDAVFQASQGTPRLINLICDRALHRGFVARVDRIEPGFVWDATADLGLETPAREVEPKAEEPPARNTSTVAPAANATTDEPRVSPSTRNVKGSSVPVLSDFEPEIEMRAAGTETPQRPARTWKVAVEEPPQRSSRTWKVACIAAALALLVVGGVFAYVWQKASLDLSRIAWPSSPKKIETTLRVPSPPAESSVATAPTPAPSSGAAPASASVNAASFTIQVASFLSEARATRLVQELAQAGYKARAVPFDLGPGGQLLQIRIEGYATLADAERELPRIREIPGYADAHILTR
jgi:general secretion pathway protein A